MDSYRGNLAQSEPTNSALHADDGPGTHLADDDDIARQPPPVGVGQDERRMQVRAYNYWAGLLGDRPLPPIEDLICAASPDFADHAVVLDFSQGTANPAVTMLGKKLAAECGAATSIAQLSDVPEGSLLSRITDRYLQISANAAPIGFEAEFVNQRGTSLVYRGILLPFSGDGQNITHIMGVINWKELADPVMTAQLRHELDVAVGTAHSVSSPRLPTWADGPVVAEPGELEVAPAEADLVDALAGARQAAETANALEEGCRTALYAAIGRAWNLALAAQADPLAFRAMAFEARPVTRASAAMMQVVALVFGTAYDKTRLAEFALALAHARRQGLERGELAGFLAGTPGGFKRVVQEERRLRRSEASGKAISM